MTHIPKEFHFIWVGSEPPAEFLANIRTWKEHHPDWGHTIWHEFPSCYPELVKACLKPRHVANLWRYEILAEHGGVYVDVDFVCQKSIEPLIDGCDFFTAYQTDDHEAPGAINNALFGCTPGHPIAVSLVRRVPLVFEPEDNLNCGPPLFTRTVREFVSPSPRRIFDRELFYPFPPAEHDRRHESFPNAYAVHGWASRWAPFTDKRAIKPW